MTDVLFCMHRNGTAIIELCQPSALYGVLYDVIHAEKFMHAFTF